jgi:hypothetical protein
MNGGIINSVTRLHLVGCFYSIIFGCNQNHVCTVTLTSSSLENHPDNTSFSGPMQPGLDYMGDVQEVQISAA